MDAKPIRVLVALDVHDATYLDALTDALALADALHRRKVTVPWRPGVAPDCPTDADLLGRIREDELELERIADAVADTTARLDALAQQHAALVARVCGLAVMSEGDLK